MLTTPFQQKTSRDNAIVLAMMGTFIVWCHIGTGIEAAKADKAKKAYKAAVQLITKNNKEKITTVKVLELVRALVSHYQKLLPKLVKAMDAMKELKALFSAQNLNFHIIDNKFEDLLTGVDAKTWAGRRNWILTAIDEAVEKFKEVGERF